MGSQKTRYRVKSTGQLVIEKGCDIKLTISHIQGYIVYELLDENGRRTGKEVQVSHEDLVEIQIE